MQPHLKPGLSDIQDPTQRYAPSHSVVFVDKAVLRRPPCTAPRGLFKDILLFSVRFSRAHSFRI